jgi:hypothetical protein
MVINNYRLISQQSDEAFFMPELQRFCWHTQSLVCRYAQVLFPNVTRFFHLTGLTFLRRILAPRGDFIVSCLTAEQNRKTGVSPVSHIIGLICRSYCFILA